MTYTDTKVMVPTPDQHPEGRRAIGFFTQRAGPCGTPVSGQPFSRPQCV